MTTTAVYDKVGTDIYAIYDRIYDIADRLFKKYNPCNIHSDNIKSSCSCHPHPTYRVHLCCSECKYISPKGCTVKCLACKLFMCDTIQEQYPILANKLLKLCRIAYKYKLGESVNTFWYTKEDWLRQIKDTLSRRIK